MARSPLRSMAALTPPWASAMPMPTYGQGFIVTGSAVAGSQ